MNFDFVARQNRNPSFLYFLKRFQTLRLAEKQSFFLHVLYVRVVLWILQVLLVKASREEREVVEDNLAVAL